MDIPWNDDAVAALFPRDRSKDGGELEMVAEGRLNSVIAIVAARFAGDIGRMRISFPERGKPPFRYEAEEIAVLIIEHARASRPDAVKDLFGCRASETPRGSAAASRDDRRDDG
jgi:hypothetical protein